MAHRSMEMVKDRGGDSSFLTSSSLRVVRVELLAHLAGVGKSLAGLLYDLT